MVEEKHGFGFEHPHQTRSSFDLNCFWRVKAQLALEAWVTCSFFVSDFPNLFPNPCFAAPDSRGSCGALVTMICQSSSQPLVGGAVAPSGDCMLYYLCDTSLDSDGAVFAILKWGPRWRGSITDKVLLTSGLDQEIRHEIQERCFAVQIQAENSKSLGHICSATFLTQVVLFLTLLGEIA